jgi:hypothetical protein
MREQRKHFYNDARLQGYLITALIVIELLLIAGLLLYLYVEFNRVIDARFYRIHSGGGAASWPEFLTLMLKVIGGFLLANALALYFAHLIWDRYVKRTVDQFADGLNGIIALDFTDSAEANAGQHRIIDLLDAWRAQERQRNSEIARLVERLANIGDNPDGIESRADLNRILEDYRRLLP